MRILSSARKHGIDDVDIRHAWVNAWRFFEIEYDHERRLLVIGPAVDGAFLELIVVPVDRPQRIIHADRLRPKFYDALR